MVTNKTSRPTGAEQPTPFTPGVRKGEVRDYAYKMFRVKLETGESLAKDDWVKAEKELIREREEAES